MSRIRHRTIARQSMRQQTIGHVFDGTKLTIEAVRDIRSRQRSGVTGVKALAREYEVAPKTVRDVCQWRTWAWLDPPADGVVRYVYR